VVQEFKIRYGIEVGGINETWKEMDKANGRFCKKLMRLLICAAHGYEEMKLGGERRKGKIE
jgi:hypothetical protein